jgi:hypothetical protein
MTRFIAYQAGGRGAILEPTKETIEAIENVIRWAENDTPRSLRDAMSSLVFNMALVNQKFARKMSFGPLDPSGTRSDLAWRVPVRRISERYYLGWKIREVSPTVFQLYNASREAYFIEFGINWLGAGRRVRRPVRKLTLRQTMEFMMTTRAYHRVWVDVFYSPKTHRGKGFSQIVQSPGLGGMGSMLLGRRLPS